MSFPSRRYRSSLPCPSHSPDTEPGAALARVLMLAHLAIGAARELVGFLHDLGVMP